MRKILSSASIIPVITPHSYDETYNVVRALVDGGISAVEVVLRTPDAVNILKEIRQNFTNTVVGAGTVTTPAQLEQCYAAGTEFIVTPGNTPALLQKAAELDLPILPGSATPSDILRAIEYNLDALKLFPANLVGGVDALKAYGAVFPDMLFCPTGGVNMKNLKEFYTLKNVIAVGGSWLTPKDLIEREDWAGITKLAQQSLNLLN